MDIYFLCFFITILIISYYYFLKINTKEYFLTKNKSSNTLYEKFKKIKLNENIFINSNFIFTTIDGIYHVFTNNKYSKLNSEHKILIDNELINITWKLPNLNIKCGYYDYLNNYIIFIIDDNIYIYDNTTKNIINIESIDSYFNNKIQINKNTRLLYITNKLYIFQDNDIIIYDLLQKTILNKSHINKINLKLSSNSIINIFNNYNNISYKNPSPSIYILYNSNTKNNTNVKYNIYNFINNKFINIKSNLNYKNKFIYNTKKTLINFVTAKANFNIENNGKYRIMIVGAGHSNGGFGGLIYNDYNFKKNTNLEFILGEQGERLELDDGSININNTITNNVLNKLENTGSSSGCGGTFLFYNNTLSMVAGGGGGWSSEKIKSPSVCNSQDVTHTNNKTSGFIFPLKKIMIESNNSYDNFILKEFSIKNNNHIIDKFSFKIKKLSIDNAKYNKIKNKKLSYLEIIFDTILSDYNIDLLIDNLNDNINLVIYDDLNNSYNINNYKLIFKNNLNSNKILNYLSNNNIIKYKKHEHVNNGNKSVKKIDELLGDLNNQRTTKLNTKYLILKGGIGGGGNSIINKYNSKIYCGGGGGFKGGDAFSYDDSIDTNKLVYPYQYVCGMGGKSYVKKLNIDIPLFNNNFNNSNGYAIIYEIVN